MIFIQPKYVVAGNIISAPEIFPRGVDVRVYTSSMEIKNIQIQSKITTSQCAFKNNFHGFVYIGAMLDVQDIEGGFDCKCFI
jgi:hypothetical protein